jgi:hypothetical protein
MPWSLDLGLECLQKIVCSCLLLFVNWLVNYKKIIGNSFCFKIPWNGYRRHPIFFIFFNLFYFVFYFVCVHKKNKMKVIHFALKCLEMGLEGLQKKLLFFIFFIFFNFVYFVCVHKKLEAIHFALKCLDMGLEGLQKKYFFFIFFIFFILCVCTKNWRQFILL